MRHQSTVYFMLVFAHEAILLVRFSSWWSIEKRFSSTESWYFYTEIFSDDSQHDEVRVFRQYLDHQYFCSSLFSQFYSFIHFFFRIIMNAFMRIVWIMLINTQIIIFWFIHIRYISKLTEWCDSETEWSTWCEYKAEWSMRCDEMKS
jgi:hypothetical protein